MLDSLEKDNKTINQMYKGNELVWELHACMLKVDNVSAGSMGLNLKFYPNNAQVTVTINKAVGGMEKYNIEGVTGEHYQPINKLQSGDKIIIFAKAIGWRLSRFFKFIN